MKALKKLFKSINKRKARLLSIGFLVGVVFIALFSGVFSYSSSTEFCISCHEMRIVAEQGWMRSPHYKNPHGVVAQCADCHIPPQFLSMLWTKTRDGMKDVFIHTFGESDPHKMGWDELSAVVREKISDSSCLRCHSNLTPHGANPKTLKAHREYLREDNKKRCLDCHRDPFHGKFKEYLFGTKMAKTSGGEK